MTLAIDLYCGLGGWADGLLAEGFDVIGFDIERHEYGAHRYPAQLVLQDVRTLHGSQFRDVSLIVASPPCQAYSYRAMPWSRAKALPPPDNELFDACFRIQAEASEAAGHHIPLIVENVRGAQKWVGRARWNFGSYYLWGDVPALMPITLQKPMKNTGGSWFTPPDGRSCRQKNCPDGRASGDAPWLDGVKIGGGANVPGIGWTGFADTGASWRNREQAGTKQTAPESFRTRQRPGMSGNSGGNFWFQDGAASFGSNSPKRKAASAMIAKIPLPLARHIGAVFRP